MRYELNIDPWYLEPEPAEIEGERQRLRWKSAGSLDNAFKIAPGPGFYKIFKNGQLLYIGESRNLPRRLRQHRRCVYRFKIPVADYKVKVARYHGDAAARRSIERRLIELNRSKGITNIREIEEEPWAELAY